MEQLVTDGQPVGEIGLALDLAQAGGQFGVVGGQDAFCSPQAIFGQQLRLHLRVERHDGLEDQPPVGGVRQAQTVLVEQDGHAARAERVFLRFHPRPDFLGQHAQHGHGGYLALTAIHRRAEIDHRLPQVHRHRNIGDVGIPGQGLLEIGAEVEIQAQVVGRAEDDLPLAVHQVDGLEIRVGPRQVVQVFPRSHLNLRRRLGPIGAIRSHAGIGGQQADGFSPFGQQDVELPGQAFGVFDEGAFLSLQHGLAGDGVAVPARGCQRQEGNQAESHQQLGEHRPFERAE